MGHHAGAQETSQQKGRGAQLSEEAGAPEGRQSLFLSHRLAPQRPGLSGAANRSQSGQRFGRERTHCSPKARPLREGWQGGLAACLEVSLSEQTDQDSLALHDILPPSGC